MNQRTYYALEHIWTQEHMRLNAYLQLKEKKRAMDNYSKARFLTFQAFQP